MSAESRGGDLFIADNSISGWTGLRYLDHLAPKDLVEAMQRREFEV